MVQFRLLIELLQNRFHIFWDKKLLYVNLIKCVPVEDNHMKTEIMLALYRYLKKDFSEENQLKQIQMLRTILEINQDVVRKGISQIEDHEPDIISFPMLGKGLKLVREGQEPQVIETILINTAFANDVDLLESLLVLEGVSSIQMLRSADVTKELLLSYFSFSMQDHLRRNLLDLQLDFSQPLNKNELSEILKGIKKGKSWFEETKPDS